MQIIKTDFFGGPVWLVGLRIWHCHCSGSSHCYDLGLLSHAAGARKKKKKERKDRKQMKRVSENSGTT